jgi:uncharacterized cupin superfamily protein
MSKLKYARTLTLGQGEPSRPDPERVLAGDPAFTSWPLLDGQVATGVWSASKGHHRVVRDQGITESFYILEGEVDLFEDGDPVPKRFGPGDLVVIEPGFKGSWKTVADMRKVYFTTQD